MFLSGTLEMPTGAFADKHGRKKAVVLSCLVLTIANLIYFFSNNFWEFVIAECIAALGLTMHNGAFQAWIFDSLKHHLYQGDINEVQRKITQYGRIGVIVGCVAGGYLAVSNLAFPWLASSFGTILAGLYCIFFLKEEYHGKDCVKHRSSIFTIAIHTFKKGLKNKYLLYLGSFELILIASFQGFNMQWTIRFKDVYKMSMVNMGYVMGFVIIALYIGSYLAKRILKKSEGSDVKIKASTIVAYQLPTAVFMILTVVFTNAPIALSCFFLHEVARGIFEPLRTIYVNIHGKTRVRATVHSFNGMMNKFGAALGLVISGIVAQTWSIEVCWLLSGFTLLITTILFIKFKINGN